MADSQSRLKPDGLLVFGYQRPHAHCDEKVKQVENERDAIVADQSLQAPFAKRTQLLQCSIRTGVSPSVARSTAEVGQAACTPS